MGAPRGVPAGLAGQARQVPRTGHLHQDRSPGEPVAHGPPGGGRHPGDPGRGVVVRATVGGARHPRPAGPLGGAVGDDLPGPPPLDEGGRLDATAPPADQRGGSGLLGPQGQHLPRMRIRRPLLGMLGVAVVPDDHQTEPGHRGERGGPGADRHRRLPAQQPQERAVPRLGAEIGLQPDHSPGADRPGKHRFEAVDVPTVRDDDHRPPAGGRRRGDGPADRGRPGRAGQRRPDRARAFAALQPRHERRSGEVVRPRTRAGGTARDRVRQDGGPGLGTRVTRRDSEPQDVAEGARVAIGHRPGQPQHLTGEHRLR